MTEINVPALQFDSLKGSVAIVTGKLPIDPADLLPRRYHRTKHDTDIGTGGSSGIGLATVKLLLEHGTFVVIGDLNPPKITHPSLTFHRTDVTSWADLSSLFKQIKQAHSSINHVFANAGVTSHADYLAETLDEAGDLIEPSFLTLEINLRAVINTVTLAMHHMRQQPLGGDVVITGSSSSFQPLCVPDYTASKHGVLGYMRGMNSVLQMAGLPIRINCIAPSWTETALMSHELFAAAGGIMQPAEAVAPSVALLMADKERNGQLIYSEGGRLWEIEEAILMPAAHTVRIPGSQTLDETLVKVMGMAEWGGVEDSRSETTGGVKVVS